MSDVAALTSVLVALAQSNDLKSTKIGKGDLPKLARRAIDKWAAIVNLRVGARVASFDSISDFVIQSRYSDPERECPICMDSLLVPLEDGLPFRVKT
jgi:hypothetical protein